MSGSQLVSTSTKLAHSSSSEVISGSRALLALEKRDRYLQRIIDQKVRPLIIVAGQSSAGKSQLVNLLGKMGYAPATRLMPRERRSDDVEGDVTWGCGENPMEHQFSNATLQSGLRTIIFSDHKYQGYYAFPSNGIADRLAKNEGATAILGRCVEIAPFIQGYGSVFPLAPVLPIRLDVPLQVLVNRLNRRYHDGNSSERNERVTALEGMQRDDRPQIEYLTWLYGMRSIFNIAPKEMRQFGYHEAQIRSITPETVADIVTSFIEESTEQSSQLAKEVITRRELSYDHSFIPNALTDVLENKLLPAAERRGQSITIQGGLAVALYLENSRPVSLDIDFTIKESRSSEEKLSQILSDIDRTPTPIQAQDKWHKAVYHVRGFSSAAVSDKYGEECELDAIVTTRAQANNEGFCFTFPYDTLDFFHRRAVTLPGGGVVFLIPPERLIMEKLVAGRGPEVGKFDLFDSAGLLATLPLNPSSIRKIIESQYYSQEIDRDMGAIFESGATYNEDQIIDILKLENPILKAIVREVVDQFDPSAEVETPSPKRIFGVTELKRLAMISAIDKGLNWITNNLELVWQVGTEQTTLDKRFDGDKILNAAQQLQAHLTYYAQFELGRHDVYGRSTPHHLYPRNGFFDGLNDQSRRLKTSKTT